MSITYAGIPLEVANLETAAWIEANISPRDAYQFTRFYWPETRICRITFPATLPEIAQPDRPINVGSLFWPKSASRWAVGHYLVTEDSLQLIRNQVFAGGYQELLLVESDEDPAHPQTITTSLWMLPPRPLAQLGPNLWLMTLVDDRFWWWFAGAKLTVTEGTTTWTDLISAIATALGITIAVDAIPAAYLFPTFNFQSYYEYLPFLLDACAYNVGMRLVRQLDGSVQIISAATSKGNIGSNISNIDFTGLLAPGPTAWKVQAGGEFRLNADGNSDINSIIPAGVLVAFDVTGTTPYVSSQTLAALNAAGQPLVEISGFVGNGNTKIFHDVALADEPTTPSNQAELDALAKQIAVDWYKHQYGGTAGGAPLQNNAGLLDIKLIGPCLWIMDGIHDSVEFVYQKEEQSTRIQRGEWNDLAIELMHAGTLGSTHCDQVGITVECETLTGSFQSKVKDVNTLDFYPCCSWTITDLTKGVVRVERLLSFHVPFGTPIAHVADVTFSPACAWTIAANGDCGVIVKRNLTVQTDTISGTCNGQSVSDVSVLDFTPCCAWNISSPQACVSVIERRLQFYTDSFSSQLNIATVKFEPSCCWTLTDNGICGVVVKRNLTVQTDTIPGVCYGTSVPDVALIEFSPCCAWTVTSAGPCGVQVQRHLQLYTDSFASQLNIATIKFEPDCCWSLSNNDLCGVKVKRLFVTTGGSVPCTAITVNDVAQIDFSIQDFVLFDKSACKVGLSTRGYTGTRYICEADGLIHTYVYIDGLLKTIDGSGNIC